MKLNTKIQKQHLGLPASRSLWISLVGLVAFFYLTGLSYGPRVSQETIEKEQLWLQNIHWSSSFGISLNKDSYYYLIGAKKSETLLKPRAILQSRPLLCFIAYPLSRILDLFPFGWLPGAPRNFNYLLTTYISFILLNFVMLIGSYWLYIYILGSHKKYDASTLDKKNTDISSTILLGTFLVTNDITKAFFFAAHCQILNLLVPLLALFVLLRLSEDNVSCKTFFIYSLLAGIAMLAYGGFIIVGTVILLARFYQYFKNKSEFTIRFLTDLFIIVTILSLPYFGWWSFVTIKTGQFYSHEVARWNQIVWMLGVFDKGWVWLVSSFANNIVFFLKSVFHQFLPLIPIIILFLFFSWPERNALLKAMKNDARLSKGAAIVAVLFLIFFSAVGFQASRLATPIWVMIIVLLGVWISNLEVLLNSFKKRFLSGFMVLNIMIQAAWIVIKDGPFY